MSKPKKQSDKKRGKQLEDVNVEDTDKEDARPCVTMPDVSTTEVEIPEGDDDADSLEKSLLAAVPTRLLAQTFSEGLDATMVKTAQSKGHITDIREFPDYRTRRQYALNIALISKRYKPNRPNESAGKGGEPIESNALTNDQLRQEREFLAREVRALLRDNQDAQALSASEGGEEPN